MICDNCGSKNVKEKEVESFIVMECQICQHLYGKDEDIKKITEIREAKELDIDPKIYPLYKIFQGVNGFNIEYSCGGFQKEKMPPYITFSVKEKSLKDLEILTQSLLKTNSQTKVHWIIEASFQKKLVFSLKPNFHHEPYYISAEEISFAQKDLEILEDSIKEFFK